MEAEKRDPGNEVVTFIALSNGYLDDNLLYPFSVTRTVDSVQVI